MKINYTVSLILLVMLLFSCNEHTTSPNNNTLQFQDTLLSLSLFCWEDSEITGDTTEIFTISNLFYSEANPPWEDDTGDFPDTLSTKYLVDTLNVHFIDTIDQSTEFQFRLTGKYSVDIIKNTATINNLK